MKTLILGTLLMAMTTTASASHYNDHSDMDQSILNDHGPGEVAKTFNPGSGDNYGSILYGMDYLEGYRDAPPQKGSGDEYGSILLDIE